MTEQEKLAERFFPEQQYLAPEEKIIRVTPAGGFLICTYRANEKLHERYCYL